MTQLKAFSDFHFGVRLIVRTHLDGKLNVLINEVLEFPRFKILTLQHSSDSTRLYSKSSRKPIHCFRFVSWFFFSI